MRSSACSWRSVTTSAASTARPSERDDILIPFLVEGLKAGSKCTCVVDSCTPDDVLASMSEQIEVDP